MKNKTKWVTWGFFSLDYKAMETYLEEMAEKGWMLEKVGQYLAKFKAMESRKLKFYVDIFKKGGILTPENNEESEAYRKLCQESGWIFITSQEYLQFFYADGDSEPVPIQTDEEIEQKIVEHTLLKRELLSIFIFSIVSIFVFIRTFPVKYGNLLSFAGVTGTFLFPVLCTFTAIPAVYSIIWMLKARGNIKNGLPIEKPTLKSARRRIIAFNGLTWIIILLFVLSFIADAFFRPDDILIAVMGPIAGIVMGSGIRYLVKKNKIKEDNSVLFTVIAIFVVIFFMSKIGSLIIENFADIYKVDSVPDGYPIITIGEIWEGSGQGNSVSREFKRSMSPITPKHYTYWESENINGNTRSINIKYYKTINPYFAEIIFSGITDRLEKGIKWRGTYILTKHIIFDDEMKNLWDMDNMALTKERDEVIIQKGSIVLHLTDFSGDIDFNDRQTRELIISRFFSDFSLKN